MVPLFMCVADRGWGLLASHAHSWGMCSLQARSHHAARGWQTIPWQQCVCGFGVCAVWWPGAILPCGLLTHAEFNDQA